MDIRRRLTQIYNTLHNHTLNLKFSESHIREIVEQTDKFIAFAFHFRLRNVAFVSRATVCILIAVIELNVILTSNCNWSWRESEKNKIEVH